MSVFIKAVAAVLLACIATMVLSKQSKDFSVILAIAVSAMVIIAAGVYLTPIIEFINRLADLSEMDADMLMILMKATGIGIISEFAVLICKDAGNSSMGKSVQILATGVILWISIPLLNRFLELLENVLGL